MYDSYFNMYEPDHSNDGYMSRNADGFRAPQLNPRVIGHGGPPQGNEDMGARSDSDSDSDDYMSGSFGSFFQGSTPIDEDDGGDESDDVEGQEGLEDGQLRAGGNNAFTESTFLRAWTNHHNRDHANRPRLGDHMAPEPASPVPLGMWSPTSSNQAVYSGSTSNTTSSTSSGGSSMEVSIILNRPANRSTSSLVAGIEGNMAAFSPTTAARIAIFTPLPLAPEYFFAREIQNPFRFYPDLSFYDLGKK